MTKFIQAVPVLPSADIERDLKWYSDNVGFKVCFYDQMYAVLYRDNIWLHLQWHADTPDDPLLGGSVVRILVKDIMPLFEEFVRRGTVSREAFRSNTPWKTNEFGFHDLNQNVIIFVEDLIGVDPSAL
jgi:hypothetical protein